MKFSIVIPTQNRPELLELVVRHAMQVEHQNFEVIVSDNSTTASVREQNYQALLQYANAPNFHIYYPSRPLSAPEHFEFALSWASGDYVTILTDKMIILPGLLSKVEALIGDHNADIVNWLYAPFYIDNPDECFKKGKLVLDNSFLTSEHVVFDPIKALRFKASGSIPRTLQTTQEYALGKIIFGVYSKDLIQRIKNKTGSLFGGATHDYSAMIQALCMAKTCIAMNSIGMIFMSLPADKSLGSLTANDSRWALSYFKQFTEPKSVISNLLVPNVYASQHNMVAHDYKKYLSIYGHSNLFDIKNWLIAIGDDLKLKNRLWSSERERKKQIRMYYDFLYQNNVFFYCFFIKTYREFRNNARKLVKKSSILDSKLNSAGSFFHIHKSVEIDVVVNKLCNNSAKRIIIFYSPSQTYTKTVYEHLDAFRLYSDFSCYYSDIKYLNTDLDLTFFDIIVVHYSVRLPFGQLNRFDIEKLKSFPGIKALFVQDEYDKVAVTKSIIKEVCFDIVFSVVPEKSIDKIYPPSEFSNTKFVNCLTGYVPESLLEDIVLSTKTSERKLTVAYRGRMLPIKYGRLGQDKSLIGKRVKDYCLERNIYCDIEWDESARIYGRDWYTFLSSAKSFLGSESGSNVFDWSGTLGEEVDQFCKDNPGATYAEIYQQLIQPIEKDGLMNQVSPRIFEMIAAKTVMVLLEGEYSGIIKPYIHYIPIKKDYSNLDEVFEFLSDDVLVDGMVEKAFQDIVLSGKYGYRRFIELVDLEFNSAAQSTFTAKSPDRLESFGFYPFIHVAPIQAKPPLPDILTGTTVGNVLFFLWRFIPRWLRPFIKSLIGRA